MASEITIEDLAEDTTEADLYRIMILLMLQNEGHEIVITQDMLDKAMLENKALMTAHSKETGFWMRIHG